MGVGMFRRSRLRAAKALEQAIGVEVAPATPAIEPAASAPPAVAAEQRQQQHGGGQRHQNRR